jgi:serine protease Do
MEMKNSVWITASGIAALAPVLMALPGHSTVSQGPEQERTVVRAVQGTPDNEAQGPDRIEVLLDEGPSWLGVEAREVTAESVKQFKLPAERGVVVGHVSQESPASKAGLQDTDVITAVDGQRVEGSAQFRRMIREIPAGRTVQLTVWRDERSQTIRATLGQAEETHRAMLNAAPGSFAFRMPDVEIPEMPDVEVQRIPGVPSMDFDNGMMVLPFNRPRLGIDAEDISGQLGSYFGAPDGEGILVRNVNAGSVAEKAGMKAGDVITKFNGDRIRSLGDLREKLAAKTDDKPAQLTLWRNKSEMTLTVDVPSVKPTRRRTVRSSTNI